MHTPQPPFKDRVEEELIAAEVCAFSVLRQRSRGAFDAGKSVVEAIVKTGCLPSAPYYAGWTLAMFGRLLALLESQAAGRPPPAGLGVGGDIPANVRDRLRSRLNGPLDR